MGNVSNIKEQTAVIMLDKPRKINFTMQGFAHLAEKHESVFAAIDKMKSLDISKMNGETISLMVDFVYAGLCWEDDDLTPKMVSQMLNLKNLSEVFKKIVEAINAALPEAPKSEIPTPPATN